MLRSEDQGREKGEGSVVGPLLREEFCTVPCINREKPGGPWEEQHWGIFFWERQRSHRELLGSCLFHPHLKEAS